MPKGVFDYLMTIGFQIGLSATLSAYFSSLDLGGVQISLLDFIKTPDKSDVFEGFVFFDF